MSRSNSHDAAMSLAAINDILSSFRPDRDSPLPVDVQRAVYIARQLGRRAAELQTPQERRQQAELDRMIQSPGDKATLMQWTDQAFRSKRPPRAADQLIHILDVQGVPRFFSPLERTLLRGFQSFGAYLPGVAMPLIEEKMHQETANVVLAAEPELLAAHLDARRAEGVRMNVNHLGEALLGEREAQRRLQGYLALLQRPEIEVISVKVSTIYSQLSPLAREHTVGILGDRLELLYRAAAKERFTRHDGTVVPKLVYLDMEEYRDKELTVDAFLQTLDRPGLEQVRAGIALQAYVPDSFATQRRINQWARQRVAAGRSPITLRIVKGANLEMERVEASIHDWPQAPYKTKLETDANYLRMVAEGMRPENIAAVRLGIASHNLFSLAYGLVLAAGQQALEGVQFEMLEGMANHQRRALFELADDLLLYAPACRQEEFINAIGYLVRRLDENTGPDNFLRHAFRVDVQSATWRKLEHQFLAAVELVDRVSSEPRRTQDRRHENPAGAVDRPARPEDRPAPGDGPTPGQTARRAGQGWRLLRFRNEPDTDWSLPQHADWAASIVARWQPRCGPDAALVPLVIAGEELGSPSSAAGRSALGESYDPSRPGEVVARYRQAEAADVDRAVDTARRDAARWRRRGMAQRRELLHQVARQLAADRAELIGAMLAEGAKSPTESDPEVSEAIDFCRFYADAAEEMERIAGGRARPRGVVAVVSPWNFPLAIPCGGVAAALAAGNTVILKPASATVLIAHRLCECFWRAGVPQTALQFAPCRGDDVAEHLVTHAGVDTVVLTGGTDTARHLLKVKPTISLLAETGGKNATIVTALADRDQAIKHVLHSAFSHSGQKCSATSLLVLESEVYHDAGFREQFCDAVESLAVGSAWNLASKVVPLIRPPSGVLETGLKELEPPQQWAVMPRLHVDDNPHLVGPGVKWGVQRGSFAHGTEFFGPLLGVIEARDLDEAIDLVNDTGYGLTSGLESLDDREQDHWQRHLRAGNLYINRPTTGAIVLRQPFGGMGKSNVGPGIKAGGPNYVVPLSRYDQASDKPPQEDAPGQGDRLARPGALPTEAWRSGAALASRPESLCELRDAVEHRLAESPAPESDELRRVLAAIDSYRYWAAAEFHATHDHFRKLGEDNLRRYRPVDGMRIRVDRRDGWFDVFARAAACRAAGGHAVVSAPADLSGTAAEAVRQLDDWTGNWGAAIEFVTESDAELAHAIASGRTDRVRYAAPERVPLAIRTAAADALHYIADTPPVAHGRIELLWYFREQSLTVLYHRYGNLGRRGDQQRDEPA